jgi:sarcosine oxidase subunit beta
MGVASPSDGTKQAKTDAIVVGAGVVGLACAYFLKLRGLAVVLIERGIPGAENSTKTGGGIRSQFATEPNIRLSLLSQSFWDEFASQFGVDPNFRKIGYLFLARTQGTADELVRRVAMQSALGVPSRALTAAQMRALHPSIADLHSFVGGSICMRDGYLNHHRVIQGLQRGLAGLGVDLRTGVEVTGLLKQGSRIVGVETTEGSIESSAVVNAAGAFAGLVAATAAIDLPIVSRRHQLLIVAPDRPVPDDCPWLIDIEDQVHMRPQGGGRVLVGGFLGEDAPVEPATCDARADPAWAVAVRKAAGRSFGLVDENSAVVASWAGLYPGTPDGYPVIEATSPGLFTAAGFAGTGLMHAPAAGRLIAEIVVDGKAQSMDTSAFSSTRFAGVDRLREVSGF